MSNVSSDHMGVGPGLQVLQKLQSDEALMGIPLAKQGLADMEVLFRYLNVYNVLDKVSFIYPRVMHLLTRYIADEL